jgi:hypothetical protein
MNLFDIMRNAGGGNAFAALAPHYGLSEEQMRKAVEAFLPAFSAGLKRSTADPFGLMEFMRRLAIADYFRAYQDPAWAGGEGRKQGDDALAFLFGSPEVADALARQASAFTGIAQEKLSELLPTLAAMIFGGLASQATAMNPMLDGMLKKFRAEPEKPAAKGPLDRYEEKAERREREAAAAAEAARAQADVMQAGLAAFQAGTAAVQETVAAMMKSAGGGAVTGGTQAPETKASGENVFGELFEPGLRLSDADRREMEKAVERRHSTTRS